LQITGTLSEEVAALPLLSPKTVFIFSEEGDLQKVKKDVKSNPCIIS